MSEPPMFEQLGRPRSERTEGILSFVRRIVMGVCAVGCVACFVMALSFQLDNPSMTDTQRFIDGTQIGWSVLAIVFGGVSAVMWYLENDDA